ncbi:hypothetical protein EJ07DRAFT_152029 [Lizonia empirigonia]|nr:hypothetical protein EJ07DRAFT_152029 [Lizonia empirigonia]
MDPKQRVDNPVDYLEKKRQFQRPSPLRQEVNASNYHDQEHTGAAGSDARSDIGTKDDPDTAGRWQELKAARTEEEEIERFRREQKKSRTEDERSHNEALHKVRLRMMRARKSGRPAERKASQIQGAVKGSAPEVDQHTKQDTFCLSKATPWRNPKRQRGRLNLDRSRIESEFILGNEFVDDVNTMLDFIAGWPKDQIQHIDYSFKNYFDNQNRRIEFVYVVHKRWTVRLLKLDRQETDKIHGPTNIYTLDDLPDDCREFGCIKGCPSGISTKDRSFGQTNFRENQNRKDPLDIMAEACRLASPSLRELPDVSTVPPPPIPPRSNKREMPPPKTAGQKRRDLPDEDTTAGPLEELNQLYRKKVDLESRLGQLKKVLSVQAPHNTPVSIRKDSVFDKLDFGPLGGKLSHAEKIPTGPKSIRVEEYMLTSVFDKRSRVPGLENETVRNKPRKEYYAKRVPSSSNPDSEGSDSPPPEKSKRPISNSVNLLSSNATQRIDFRPQYERNPESY